VFGSRDALRVGIVGLGYVGLPLVVAFAQAGAEVIALDSDDAKVAALRRSDSYIEDVPSDVLKSLSGQVHATTRYADLRRGSPRVRGRSDAPDG